MNWILRVLWYLIKRRAKARVIWQAKRHAILAYLRAVQITRQIIIAGVVTLLFLQGVVFAGFGALVTGVWMLNIEFESKLRILFFSFGSLFLLPLLLLSILLSEGFWYRVSGSKKLVDDFKSK